ncbi:NACHT and WD repeat domain-containing protein [Nocardia salmonicida]|uniref:NACHT and WD repeat domain-containing protein n=1 Tax=Nocardia salmonicida TaxID=53431 RepID=UPI00378ED65F
MTNSDEQSSSPRALFAQRFAELYAAAGNPTLRRVATATERRMRGAQAGTPSPQRISDWKAGRNVPARFESLLPVVLTLVEMTEKAQRDLPRKLADPHEWRRLWQESVTWTAAAGDGETCPYPGLRAYLPEEHTLFFGREQATAEFVDLVRATTGIVVLIGASGAGKSSLLAAGLRPTIDLPAATMTPGATPTAGLAAALTDDVRVLIVDQFEELFTLRQDEAERAAFLSALADLPDSVTVVLALRADFYEQCLHYPILRNGLQHNNYLLGAMSMDEVSHAITGPAAAAGLTLEPGLEELVLTELRGLGGHLSADGYDPGALPLLSHVMAATWQQREGRKLTVAGYRKAGGVAGSVAETAELAWSELTPGQQAAAQELLGSLVTVGQDGRDTRRTVDRAELLGRSDDPGNSVEALEVLAASRLIALDAGSVQFSHEIVLTAWPRLRGWIDTDRVGHLVRQRLEHDATEWEAAKHDSALLYRGTRLDNANEHTDRTPISPRVRSFLHASRRSARNGGRRRIVAVMVVFALLATGVIAVDRSRLADQRALDRDYAELVAAAHRTRNSDPSISAQFLLAAYRIRPDDATRTQLLNSQDSPLAVTVAAHARGVSVLAFRPADALLVSIDDAGDAAFWDLRDPARPRRLTTSLGTRIDQLEFVPGSTDAVTIGNSGTQLWDLARPESPRLVHTLDTLRGEKIAVDPTGTRLAEIDGSTLTVWNIHDRSRASRTVTLSLPDGSHAVHTAEFGPGGAVLAVGTVTLDTYSPDAAPDTVQLWDTAGGRPIGSPISTGRDYLEDFALSRDGSRLAIGTQGTKGTSSAPSSQFELWDITDPHHPRTFGTSTRVDNDVLVSITFHQDGNLLATGSYEAARLWNIADPAQPVQAGPALSVSPTACPQARISLCSGGPTSLLFLPGEPILLGAGRDGLLRTWTLPRSTVDVIPRLPAGAMFDRTGDRMAMLTRTSDVVVWDTTDARRPARLTTIMGGPGVSNPVLSSDGRTLSLHDRDGNRRIVYALDDPRHPQPLPSWPTGEATYSMVKGNRMLLTFPDSVQMWDVTDRIAPEPFGPPIAVGIGKVLSAGFSLDGSLVDVVLADRRGDWDDHYLSQIWNLDDRTHPRLIAETDAELTTDLRSSQFLPDNRTIAVTKGDHFGLWDTDAPGTFTPLIDAVRTEIGPISWISASADGTELAVSSDDGTTGLWNLDDPHAPRKYGGPLGPADGRNRQVTMHPRGEQLMIVTDNGQLGVWDLDAETVAARICASTARLTQAVWRGQLANVAYRSPCP